MDKPKKSFQCPHCLEKPFTTLQNLKRHITRKHKDIFETKQEIEIDNISILSNDTTIISINYQSDNDEVLEIIKPDSTPSREELIDIRNKYMKYQHLYEKIDKEIRWDANNANVDLSYYEKKHSRKITYILTDIKDLYAKPLE
jgi:hypothetical protein